MLMQGSLGTERQEKDSFSDTLGLETYPRFRVEGPGFRGLEFRVWEESLPT